MRNHRSWLPISGRHRGVLSDMALVANLRQPAAIMGIPPSDRCATLGVAAPSVSRALTSCPLAGRLRGAISTWVLGLLLLVATSPAAAQPPSYERWHEAGELAPGERRALAVVRAWANARGLRLAYDARLGRAARTLLTWAPRSPAEGLPLEDLRRAAWREGWTDGELAAVSLKAPLPRLGAALRRTLETQLGQADVNSVGVAAQEGGVVVALSRRLVRLVPMPARVAPGAETLVAGRAAAQEQVTLAFGYPNGVVHRVRLPTVRGAFMQRVAVGQTPGIMDVQVLVDRGRGPEVAAQFPVGIGRSPWEVKEPAAAPAPADDDVDPRALLWSLLWGARDAHGLALPTPHGGLTRVAQAHADDMSRRGYFAHLSPTTGDVTDRLRAQGIAYVRVLENIAAAPSIDEAFAQWLRSPSHRANLLDPAATFAGVGVARGAGAARDLVVLVMARLSAG
jgi:hypothetical protein